MSDRVRAGLVLLAGVTAVLLFIGLSVAGGGAGFPLDDGWIHQTYARSLAETGRWEYAPGQVSAGSTSPLWTLLLVLGYLLHLPYLAWAFVLGAACLFWLTAVGAALWRRLWPQQAGASWLAALALLLTWQLVWAAVSGMETLLFMALGLQIILLYVDLTAAQAHFKRAAWLGILSGLLILTRPDGLVLLVLVAGGLLLKWSMVNGQLPIANGRSRLIDYWLLITALITALLPLIPYFIFNYRTSGTLWPNTFYAKQAEYAVELARPFLGRLAQMLYFSVGGAAEGWRGISGAQLLLLPGLVWAGWLALRADWVEKRLLRALPLLWAGGHVFLYAWRLPVTYQHGRYLLAALPVWVLYGLAGWGALLKGVGNGRLARVGALAARLTFALLLLIFLLFGAAAYADDVAFIEGEMVATAHWLAANTAPDALIAAHDIGAIGYFGQRPLLDLAGLISPEIIPMLDDEAALAATILQSDADYLVTAPGWTYQQVTAAPGVRLVFNSGYVWTVEQGGNNTAVYQLPRQD
ncbi:MAG: hypothetical protein H6662_03300 [Ardenticatenaceae bacterium]|nr:hypothetical protein [Ardenticatenaceae bacterium]MCB8990212.1 hypothetical protein [Ardenticatenaceae bacterium]MCB9002996.1 hypothetical protein [Ardenticatenaceae bacterium]